MSNLLGALLNSARSNHSGGSPGKGKMSGLAKKLSKRFTNMSNMAKEPTAEEVLAMEHQRIIKEAVEQIKSLKNLSSISKERLYKFMKVVTLKQGQDLPQKDFMALDMIYLHRAPNDGALRLEMTKYEGGLDLQKAEVLTLEQGCYIDSFKLKSGDNAEGIDTNDFIVRKIVAGKKNQGAIKRRITLRDSRPLTNRSSTSSV